MVASFVPTVEALAPAVDITHAISTFNAKLTYNKELFTQKKGIYDPIPASAGFPEPKSAQENPPDFG